jgi:glucose uptake protein GlcU
MGRTAYVGWALLMACQILFSSLLGAFFLGEWRATGRRTRALLAVGLALLILTAVLSGFSGYLALA